MTDAAEKALYQLRSIDRYNGNPLIEALPEALSDADWVKYAYEKPEIKEDWIFAPSADRITALDLITDFNFPFPEYIELFRRMESAIVNGYLARNPLTPTGANYLYYNNENRPPVHPRTGKFQSEAKGMTLVGPSGSGKTRLFQTILSRFPQVIDHTNFRGVPLKLKQLVWLSVCCTEDSSPISLLDSLFWKIDSILGTKYLEKHGKKNRGQKRIALCQILKDHWTGVLVIDELSNLKLPKKIDPKNIPEIVKLLLNIMNDSGVPILLVGNHEMLDIVQFTFRVSRRAEAGGVVHLGAMDEELWTGISKRLWSLQLLKKSTPWNENLALLLFEESGGIIDLAVRGFVEAQRLAIASQTECLDEDIVRSGVKAATKLTGTCPEPVPDLSDIMTAIALIESDTPSTRKHKNNSTKPSGAPYRVQHPEFAKSVNQLKRKIDLASMHSDPSILRSCEDIDNAEDYLYECGILPGEISGLSVRDI